jgi:hydroxymethylbilane synthase
VKRLVIATRRSALALWQAGHVKQLLEARHAGLEVELLPMSTRGDELLNERLDNLGGKGLFVKELESAMLEGRADLAVHSMKDVPAELPPGFSLVATIARQDARDAFVSSKYPGFGAMPKGAVVGTSSLRRASQIGAAHPGLGIRLLRGNVETRLAKLDRGEYDAIVLAAAGLVRLGLEARISARLEVNEMLPAPGQGALGIECLLARADVASLCASLQDVATATSVRAERAVSRALGGNCSIPLAAYAQFVGPRLRLRALVASVDGQRLARADLEGEAAEPEVLGERVAEELKRRGAGEILASIGR